MSWWWCSLPPPPHPSLFLPCAVSVPSRVLGLQPESRLCRDCSLFIVCTCGLVSGLQLDKDLNTFAMRIKEWYSWHFPVRVRPSPNTATHAHALGLGTRLAAYSPRPSSTCLSPLAASCARLTGAGQDCEGQLCVRPRCEVHRQPDHPGRVQAGGVYVCMYAYLPNVSWLVRLVGFF